jgi:hypothetical protein
MKGELQYVHSKTPSRVSWIVFYAVITISLAIGFYMVSASMKTRTLPVGEIQLTIPYSKYVVGEIVTFDLANNYNSPVYVTNDCPNEPLNVYRKEGNSWVRVHDIASVTDCPLQDRMVTLAPKAVTHGSFKSWPHLFATPGLYRVVAYVEYYDALPFQEFEVIAAPAPRVETPTQVLPQTTIPKKTVTPQTTTPTQTPTPTRRIEPNDD